MTHLLYALLLSLPILSCNAENEESASDKEKKDTSALSEKEEIHSAPFPDEKELLENYTLAITEYMKACYEKDKTRFDTLYIGKHADFPEMELPERIENTVLIPVIPEEDRKTLPAHRKAVYLNIFGWIDIVNSEFMIVTFHTEKNGDTFSYYPQHNCKINLDLNPEAKELKLKELKFEFPYTGNK